jgi:hypothetical protein
MVNKSAGKDRRFFVGEFTEKRAAVLKILCESAILQHLQ